MFERSWPLIVASALFVGCGTSQTYHNVTTEQKNDEWQPAPISSIAVVAVTEDRGERIGSETVFADRLQGKGINATPSYEIIPDLNSIDTTDEAAAAFAEKNIDAVLTIGIARPAQGYDRGTYWEARGWAYLLGSDNSRSWGDLADISDYWSQGEYSLDIGLWDARTMQPIWHAQTDSNEWDEGSAAVSRLADSVTEMLVERGYL